MESPHYFHCCTNGLKRDCLFLSDSEFVSGMNRIGLCLLACRKEGRKVFVIAFCLLNNHVHFILHGTEEDCREFMEKYKRLTIIWIGNHREECFNENVEIGLWKISNGEKLRKKIIYVLRNALEAGVPVTPQGYRWCSAPLMFTDFAPSTFKKASEISGRKLKQMFNTNMEIPSDWLVSDGGLIWPGSYTKVSTASKQFKGPKDFMYMLNQSAVDREECLEEIEDLISVPDDDVKVRAREIALKLFNKEYISKCTVEERIMIAKILKDEFKSNYKQLARIVRMDPEYLKKLV